MKNLLAVLILIVISTVGYSQAGRPMNGNYVWNGVMEFKDSTQFKDTIFIDSTVVNVTNGFYLKLDSTGVSQTGLYHIVTDTIATSGLGTVKGTGSTNQVPYWAASDSLSSSAQFTFNPTLTELKVASATSTLPFAVTGVNGDTVSLLGFDFSQNPTDMVITGLSSRGLDINSGSENIIEVDQTSTGTITINATNSFGNFQIGASSGFLIQTDLTNKYWGIATAPFNPLHIDAQTNTAIRLDNAATTASGAGTPPNNNFPTANNPAIFLLINLGGTSYYLPLYAVP